MKEIILPYVLLNAVKYGGRANPGAVLGHVLASHPELKSKVRDIQQQLAAIIPDVNKLPREEQLRQLHTLAPHLLEEKHEEKKTELRDLTDAKPGKVVMRFAPSPSGPLHIGHAYLLSLNSEYCKKYAGKLILRLEDTNPSNIDPDAYKMIEEDAQWLTRGNVAQVLVQSDRLSTYYDYAEKLVQKGHGYVCTCNPDAWKGLSLQKLPCPCRNLPAIEQLKRYHGLFITYQAGEAVLRLKTDVTHKNPAMRDFALMRINEEEHPRTKKKYRVWPLMNFAVAVDDHDMGITHTVRAKEHMDNEKKQQYIFDAFGWRMPYHYYVGRINFKDLDISKTKTKQLIVDRVYTGWDDIRLPFFRALSRRGYTPDAFIRFSMEVGMTQNDKTVSAEEYYKNINAFNKEVIDKQANRYFFIEEPKLITIENAPAETISLELHPDNPEAGKRTFKTGTDFYITGPDYDALHADVLYRLMDCLNFEKRGGKFFFHSKEYETYKNTGARIMHWLPKSDALVKVEVVMPDKTTRVGLGEAALKKLYVGDVVQFERFGFVRLDERKNNHLVFWFAHK
ncbi:glutamate--tRNA ligase [Candidatus Woesearchaeota archaeon]|nr:glutamate--tRNA ligase [Candidatus Woesearchaeota archaeon]